ncbi:DUF389 domain-containing protein [Nocardioides sp.]|uniref:DUF389 domain-containing protein n=1 Tax=Nocardioides sp. TaxID=35761 RepID=UPI003D0FE70B
MLLHVRLNVPVDLAPQIRELLLADDHVTNVVSLPGASLDPAGDLITCEVARESAGDLLTTLTDLGLRERGGIVVVTPTATPFAAARRLEVAAPGHPDDAVIWEAVVAKADAASRPTVTFHLFLVLATILAAIAVITDSTILIIGAMVVGPEFGVVAAICIGIVFARWGLVLRSVRLLVLSFTFAILVVALLGLLGAAVGDVTAEMVSRPRPQTGFIWHPDRWSFIVALVAGAAGVLALSTNKADALVGVFISVTTVPAAGNLALALATWETGEMQGALGQLGINLLGMVVAGVVVLALQRLLWDRVMAGSERLFGIRQSGAGGAR